MRMKILFGLAFVIFAVTAWAAGGGQQTPSTPEPAAMAPKNSTWQSDAAEGEKRFSQHCGRCHTPPSSISPRIAKTVVRHMRVRASLSKEDERTILKFLAPTLEP